MGKTTRLLWLVPLIMALTGCHSADLSLIPSEGKYDVRILRDEWGVPHIFGKTDADVGYGLGYAHSEDDWTNVENQILTCRGQMASVAFTKRAFVSDNLVCFFRVRESVDEKYETEVSPEVRALVEAYAEGVTHYAVLNRSKMPHIELPVTGKDIVAAITFMTPFFYELQNTLQQVLPAIIPVPKGAGLDAKVMKMLMARLSEPDSPFLDSKTAPWMAGEPVMGSNAWAVGPSRSTDGATRLAINSHMPWGGPIPYYEAHLHSEQGWNMTGSTFPGGPLIFMGHDENKGWAHTISKPFLASVKSVRLNPDNPEQYWMNDEWHDFERSTAKIKVKLFGPFSWTIERETHWTPYGPALWNPPGASIFQFAGYGQVRQLDQWYRMNKARNLAEFTDAMRMLGLLSLNTLYADKNGNIFYAYTGRFPLPPESSTGFVPPDFLWTGEVYPFDRLPQVLNPPSGFIQNCNSSPFYTTLGPGNPDPEEFPSTMGVEGALTNRSRRVLELYGTGGLITREDFYDYKYDKKYTTDAWVVKYINDMYFLKTNGDPLLEEAVRLLKSWDWSCGKDNRAAALALMVGWNHNRRDEWVVSNGVSTQHNVLREAANLLIRQHGRLDVPLEEVLRLRHGEMDLGLGGCPECVRAVYPDVSDDGHLIGYLGDTHFQLVEWDKDGRVRSGTVHQYGNATGDAISPHYNDQAPLFVNEQVRPVLLTEDEVRQHLKREYRPGEISEPWYEE